MLPCAISTAATGMPTVKVCALCLRRVHDLKDSQVNTQKGNRHVSCTHHCLSYPADGHDHAVHPAAGTHPHSKLVLSNSGSDGLQVASTHGRAACRDQLRPQT
jgi:hypothetical protein